ncbi:hypothetical protein [Paenibacillus algorifonticola]|uniref:hypothetical protein n=1 Tax=Paenibacillus algorifonticola TaxID=684063 RepID=UPI001160BD5B|nr:hypothetical protein [Paenibacillus algorifonticola]
MTVNKETPYAYAANNVTICNERDSRVRVTGCLFHFYLNNLLKFIHKRNSGEQTGMPFANEKGWVLDETKVKLVPLLRRIIMRISQGR